MFVLFIFFNLFPLCLSWCVYATCTCFDFPCEGTRLLFNALSIPTLHQTQYSFMGSSGWALGICDCEDLKNISWHCTSFIWIAKLVIIFNSTSLLLCKIKNFVAHNIDPSITFASSNSSRWH